jgi:hypothetical protein
MRISRLLALPAVAALLAACTPASPAAAPTTATPPATASPTAQPSPTATPVPPTAWAAVEKQVHPDGSVSTQTALQAFALAIGPLPGVTVPAGDQPAMADGTAAVAYLVQHWQDITADQRAAAVELLPNLGKLQPTPTKAALARRRAPTMVEVALRGQNRPDDYYQKAVQQQAVSLASVVGVTFTLAVTAAVDIPINGTAYAETSIVNSSGTENGGAAATCQVTVAASGDQQDGEMLGEIIAHEAWHCVEGQILGVDKYWHTPRWIIEGEAAWVAETYHPTSPGTINAWYYYLIDPTFPLFARQYTAIGFFETLQQSGVDMWSKLVPVLTAKDNVAAFTAAGGASDFFLDQWGSTYARDAGRGTAWDIIGAGAPAFIKPAPNQMSAADGAGGTAAAPAYGNDIWALQDAADVVMITSSGHARISDGAGHDYILGPDNTFCHKDGGCECPNQDTSFQPPLPLPGTSILLGLTGGMTGVNTAVVGMSLENFCKKANLTGVWHGIWAESAPDVMGGSFTVTWTQKGNTVSGTIVVTGTECITAGTVTGTIKGNAITFGAVQGLRLITYSGTFTNSQMNGTFSTPKCGDAVGTWAAHRP